jgi:hypothetical protein
MEFIMADAPNATITTQPPLYEDLGTAPFIYFDMAPSFGVMAGAVQIELASRILIPNASGGVDVKFIATAHLRCSPAAAQNLRSALEATLKMFEQPQEQPSVAAGRLN